MDVVEPGAILDVADGQLDDGVVTVEGVDVDGVAVQVGDEAWWRQSGHSRCWQRR